MYPQNPPQYPQPNGNPNYDYSHMPQNSYQYQPPPEQPTQQTWANDSSQNANFRNRNPHPQQQDLLTDNPFIDNKKPESLMDEYGSSNQQRVMKPNPQPNQQMYSNVQPPSINSPPIHQTSLPPQQQQPPKPEQDVQSLALINQMQSYFLKIMQYMDNVDKRITSLERMTKELQEKAQNAPASSDMYARKPEIDTIKKTQETVEQDLELARKLQSEFNDEVSKAKSKTTVTSASSTKKETPKATTGQCPVCNKTASNIEAHIEECLAEAERQEKAKLHDLGKPVPPNSLPNRKVMAPPMPGQPGYFPPYPQYFVDPSTGQMAFYPYPPNMQPPSYPGTQK